MDRFADGIFGPFIQELGILTQFACLLRRYEKGRLKTLYIGFQRPLPYLEANLISDCLDDFFEVRHGAVSALAAAVWENGG